METYCKTDAENIFVGLPAKVEELCIYQCNKHEPRIFMEPLNRNFELSKGKMAARLMVNSFFPLLKIPSNSLQRIYYINEEQQHKLELSLTPQR